MADAPVVAVFLGVAVHAVADVPYSVSRTLNLPSRELRLVVLQRARLECPRRWLAPPCRKAAWTVSSSPSMPCIQLLARYSTVTWQSAEHVALELRQRRRHRVRAHVGPDHAVAVDARVGLRVHLGLEIRLGRLRRHVDAVAGRCRTSSRDRRSAGLLLRCVRRTSRRRGAGRRSASCRPRQTSS